MNDRIMNNDSPLTSIDDDRLGFVDFAQNLANVLLRGNLSSGLIVGLEGAWGSGKSSVANIALLKLEDEKNAPRIIRFAPWIVGNRLDLIQELFREFEEALADLLPNGEQEVTMNLLRQYAKTAPVLTAISNIMATVGIPFTNIVAQFVKATGDQVSELVTPPLATLNEQLRARFKELKRPIVVFVDDLDRLEPSEAVEVLRLIRAVANFPQVAYLLAYDPQHLAKCLERAAGVEDGKAYLEKFIQASVTMPVPLSVDLKSWLTEELRATLEVAEMAPSARERMNSAIACWCAEYISIPRDVVRVGNAVRLYLVPVADQIDLADGLFVQILRIAHPELHDLVERYVTSRFMNDPYDFESQTKAIRSVNPPIHDDELARIVRKRDEELGPFINNLREHLPELTTAQYSRPLNYEKETAQQFADGRRLWSASYFRLYFSLSDPSGAISESEVRIFLEMCTGNNTGAQRYFHQLCNERRPQGGNMAEVLLSRIWEYRNKVSSEEVEDLLVVLGGEANEFARHHEKLRKDIGSPLSLSGDIVDIVRLIDQMDTDSRLEHLVRLFDGAHSLTWLSAILHKAALEHGLDRSIESTLRWGGPHEGRI